MAINLTYDPANDPETIEAEEQRDLDSLEVGEKLVEEQEQLLAGKYKDAEELEQAYIELQRKLGSKDGADIDEDDSQEETEVDTDEDTEEEENPFENDLTAQAIFQASAEWEDDGELTPETMEALTQMDSKDLVEAYYRIQEYAPEAERRMAAEAAESTQSTGLTDSNINDIQNAVGGEEAYNQMIQWAGENFTPQEIQAYDNALEAGNMDNINLALQALYYRYTDSVGVEGDMIQGKAAQAVDGFRSQQEVVRAMSDERYDNDPAYRQDVYNKLERSNIKF